MPPVYSDSYIQFLIQFHGYRDYFECHELLEEHWKEKEAGMRDKHWVGLIQLAVGLYHHRRGNLAGAEKVLLRSSGIIAEHSSSLQELSIDTNELLNRIYIQLDQLSSNSPYSDLNIPLTDAGLVQHCIQECSSRQLVWQMKSNLEDKELIDRHTRRDRSDVIKEREEQKLLRQLSSSRYSF
ncbi:DUF309 domain-containing protein [Sinobaca sp. H24]|uniref:DUF309 domain-containing protein n=1 Tax=Sinobaca sp. H24 TaxID=2923376 RepID=UPI00207A6A13|nr:DUF309 domain-containing protein [Sinobaca sp. H24]